eukprot:6199518-Pleurochrysis_carterae.AAC.2
MHIHDMTRKRPYRTLKEIYKALDIPKGRRSVLNTPRVSNTREERKQAVARAIRKSKIASLATAMEAELFAKFATIRKTQAGQDMNEYGGDKARVFTISDCVTGIRAIASGWRKKKSRYRNQKWGHSGGDQHREKVGTLVFSWAPSHVGIVPDTITDATAGAAARGSRQATWRT